MANKINTVIAKLTNTFLSIIGEKTKALEIMLNLTIRVNFMISCNQVFTASCRAHMFVKTGKN